jgi:hypothetical protein
VEDQHLAGDRVLDALSGADHLVVLLDFEVSAAASSLRERAALWNEVNPCLWEGRQVSSCSENRT